jgi:hypothetical protein
MLILGKSKFAELTPGVSRAKFNSYFLNLKDCKLVVPNYTFYRRSGGQGMEGDSEYDRLKRLIHMRSFYKAPVFQYTFTFAAEELTYIFSYEKDLLNNSEPIAWKVVDKEWKEDIGIDDFAVLLN